MSSAGQAVGGVVGAVVGFFVGGPSGALYGAQLGMMAGGLIDPPKGPNITGPRLDDLKVQTSTYGAPIPRLYGTIATAGNIFWLENNALKEVSKKNKSGGKGGPSTTTTTFSYYATFALGLCDCSDGNEVSGIRRIWCGSNLIYDAGSDDIGTLIASNDTASLFTFHSGSIDQYPDDRMQASLGVENTPAYRGLCYLVFNDFPLADYNNMLASAQFKIEIIKYGSSSFSTIGINVPAGNWATCAWSGEMFVIVGDNDYKVSRSFDGTNWTNGVMPLGHWASVAYNGSVFCALNSSGTFSTNCAISYDGLSWSYVVMPTTLTPAYWKDIVFNGSFFCAISAGFSSYSGYCGVSIDGISWTVAEISPGIPASWQSIAWNGEEFCIVSNSSLGYVAKSSDGINWTLSTIPSTQGFHNIAWDGSKFCVTSRNGPISALSSDGVSWTLGSIGSGFSSSGLVWNGFMFFTNGGGLNGRMSYDGISWASVTMSGTYAWDDITTAGTLIFTVARGGTSTHAAIIRPDCISDASSLSSVIESECLLSNLLSISDIDTTSIDKEIRGYKVSSVSTIRSSIETLQIAWPFDTIQRGYKIVFHTRGSASVETIQSEDIDSRISGESAGVSITNVREMDSVLPRRVVVNYLDVTREYDTGTQADERLNTDSVNISTIELAIVLNATEALGIVQTLLYLYWLERYDISFSLPSTYNHLEPGDTITINADEATYSLRLTNVTYTQDGRLECAAKYNASAIYIHAASADEGQSNGQTLTIAGGTAIELLDIPLLLDSLDTPGFPVAMTGYLPGWPGGELFRSDDAGQTWIDLQGFTTPGAVIGTASNVLSDPKSTAMIDKASTLTVNLIRGELSSVTELAMLNGANYFAYGAHGRWEIIAAQNCVIQVGGAYILTDLLRGQQGTEWACGLHAAGDKVVEIDASVLSFVSANLNSIGMTKTYRGVTIGKTIDSASDVNFNYSGVNLECLSPVYLNGNRNSANDWSLTWIRRTRVGGALRDYVDASLGEASEAYEVEIYSSNTYATLKRTTTGLTTPAAAYTSAQQVADFGSNQSTLYVKIYQLSANVGRGYPLITSITR